MKKIVTVVVLMGVGFALYYKKNVQAMGISRLTIAQAIEQDIQNIKDGRRTNLDINKPSTNSLVQQMVDALLEDKQANYPQFAERHDEEVQTLLSNAGEYNLEYVTSWADPNSNYANFEQRLRRLGNDRITPRYQEVVNLR